MATQPTAQHLSERQLETLDDLCRNPGMFAIFYSENEVDDLPSEFVRRDYSGPGGFFLGLPKLYPTEAARAALAKAESRCD